MWSNPVLLESNNSRFDSWDSKFARSSCSNEFVWIRKKLKGRWKIEDGGERKKMKWSFNGKKDQGWYDMEITKGGKDDRVGKGLFPLLYIPMCLFPR